MSLASLTLALSLYSLISLISLANGYSHGAPARSCQTLLPNHGADKQYGQAPFEIRAQTGTNGNFIVTVRSTGDEAFAGFMLQARMFNDREKIVNGKFSEDKQSQTRNCNGDQPNTLTHRSGTPKYKVESSWSPPKGFVGQIVFRATIVQSKTVYWTAQDSSPIQVGSKYLSRAGFTEVNNRIDNQPSPTAFGRPAAISRLDYNQCDRKLCFGLPDDCVGQKSCGFLLTTSQAPDGTAEFEVQADAQGGQNRYWAVGLSTDGKMGQDSVMECVLYNGRLTVRNSFNVGHRNEPLSITEIHGVTPLNMTLNNGIAYCRWRRQRRSTLRNMDFDLLDSRYHLLLAQGTVEDDSDNGKAYHDDRLASTDRVSLASVGTVTAGASTFLIKFHGCLMVIAWMGTVSVGILMARHYKQVWSDQTWCGVKVWFACHRALMLFSVSLMAIAFLAIYSHVGELRTGVHQILGYISLTLAVIQPLGALFRPHPDAKNRWVFNWLHWMTGNVAQILAIAAVFLAYNLRAAQLPIAFLWLVLMYIFFHILAHIVLQVQVCVLQNKSKKTVDITLRDMRVADPSMSDVDAPGSSFRRFFLGIYLVMVFGLLFGIILCLTLPLVNVNS